MINELDNLKNAWKTLGDAQLEKEYSADELMRIVKKRSNNELMRIRRKIITEWLVALVLSVLLVVFIQYFNPADTLYALLLVGAILLIGVVPYIKVLQLKYSPEQSLKDHITLFLDRFNALVAQYIKMAAVLMPVAGIGGFLLGYHSVVGVEGWSNLFTLKGILFLIALVLILAFGGHWVQKRFFNWIYGKNIQRLKLCLKDLEEVED